MHSFLLHVHVPIAAEALNESRAVQCASQVTRVAVESFCLTESSTVQDFLLLTRRLAHGRCSWPTDSVDYYSIYAMTKSISPD